MKTRIKSIKKDNKWYYAVQIKKWIFWKIIYTDAVFANVEKFIDTLAKIDDFNVKAKSLNKIVYEGWVVRNVYKNTGASNSVSFFDSTLHKYKDYKGGRIWADFNDNIVPIMEIKVKKLFGKECLEPMRLRITIEQIEE